ncbi:nucleotidyltransferase domain-containing protein [Saccharibacillus sp. CPCC 101409]|uniref:nucleotidyltransferase domain-containing protein n=1 Tax=Saccharibacillus sp. CPCC 101409 TaxID=3058041 RepID=UPI00267241EA|nr:nucleotidyltransferase domain-containing protein [Saccharibacillus sp. CPCC 101409]MDO3411826.1 nucleotidyltransferase domain-containing protein [Saccharibacillus sp. CPCC 101409]
MAAFNVFDVSAALIERIRRDYADDVAIAAYYGSYLDGTATERSDLDFFFIPATPAGHKAGLAFILNGISFDFWPISWERAGCMARMEDAKAGILADCKLLYVRSDEDLERFNQLKHQLKDIRSFEGDAEFASRARQRLNDAYPCLYELRRGGAGQELSLCRQMAFEVMAPALEALALLNRTTYNKGWGRNLSQMFDFAIRPEKFEATLELILRSANIPEVIAACERLVDEVAELIRRQLARYETEPDYPQRGEGFFEEFKGILDKVQSACERRDYELAFFSAVQADSELNRFLVFCETGTWKFGRIAAEEGRKIAERAKLPALTPLLDPDNLFALQSAAHMLETFLERYLREQGVEIRRFDNLEPFRRFLLDTE